MSITYDSTTFAVPPARVPPNFASREALEDFVAREAAGDYDRQKAIRHSRDAGEASLTLYGSSRNGWFDGAVAGCSRALGLTALDFLDCEVHEQKLDQPDPVFVLDAGKIAGAIAAVSRIFEWARQEPLAVAEQMAGYESQPDWKDDYREKMALFTRKLILDAVEDEAISVHPYIYIGDEGTGPEYFFGYLRTLLLILQRAVERGQVVVHIQEPPG